MDHGNLRGVGIQKIEQISSSTDSLGANVIRVTLDDGSFYDYTVRNGDRGPAGSIWIGTSAPPDDSYSIWLNPSGMVSGYVGANQGAENSGRVLAVGEDGVVITREETQYTLPKASPDALGGVKADAVEATDTQPVRIGGDGKLYTAPGGGGADISLGISGATAGQMAKVKAVDESGAPTAWEAGDAAGGYIGYGNRNPDYTYTVTEVISGLYISEINGNTFSANKLACLVEFPAGTGGFYYHALYTLQGSKDRNYCISNHNAPKLSNISTKDSVVFFIVEKLNNQNYKYNYIGQCKAREQLLDGSYGTYAAGIFPNSIEGETSIKSILLQGENAFGVGVKISIWLN